MISAISASVAPASFDRPVKASCSRENFSLTATASASSYLLFLVHDTQLFSQGHGSDSQHREFLVTQVAVIPSPGSMYEFRVSGGADKDRVPVDKFTVLLI